MIVIVVIAILAAITLVAFNGIRQRAVAAQVQSSLRNVSSAMESEKVVSGSYPTSVPSSYRPTDGVTVTFLSGDGTTYCIDATGTSMPSVSYFINSETNRSPKAGSCSGGGDSLTLPGGVMANLRLRLEAKNISQSDNTTVSSWADTSGGGRNATASGSPKFRDQSGVKYLEVSASNSLAAPSVGITGAQPRHVFAAVNTSVSRGTMLGFGQTTSGGEFDLWHYSDGQLVWHGYGGGFDTLGNGPSMSSYAWHVIEASYDGSEVAVKLDGGMAYTRAVSINTGSSSFTIGRGSWDNSWSGYVKSVMVFSQKLSDTDAQTVRSYMAQ